MATIDMYPGGKTALDGFFECSLCKKRWEFLEIIATALEYVNKPEDVMPYLRDFYQKASEEHACYLM